MLTRIEIDGKWYHAQEVQLQPEFEDSPVELKPLFDENGYLIPISICLCFAYRPSECCCDTDSWANYCWEDDYE